MLDPSLIVAVLLIGLVVGATGAVIISRTWGKPAEREAERIVVIVAPSKAEGQRAADLVRMTMRDRETCDNGDHE